jgi:penicillin-binding protein 1C
LPPDPGAPQLCRKKRTAWVLDGVIPPTFAERDARLWSAGRERIDVDARTGQRLTAECTRPHARKSEDIARWPALASPWLSQDARTAARFPQRAVDCTPDGRDATENLRIDGLVDRATIASPPNSTAPLRLRVRAIGSDARIRWLLDGRLIGESNGGDAWDFNAADAGAHSLTALAETGAWASIGFRVLR